MARQVLPWVGAAVGFVVTGGNPMGAQAGFAIGSIVGNAIDPIEMQGRKLGDAPSQVAAEGGARAIVFGKGCIRSTCILERGGRRVIKKRDSSGGKGGSPTTVNERALWTFAIGLGEAIPGGAILRIWEQEKLVYDVTPGSAIPEESASFAEKFRFYDGSEDQLPDPAIEAIHDDDDDAPYYRGTAYVVFPQYDLTDFGESVPTYRFEVAAAVEVSSHLNSWNPDQTTAGLVFSNGNKTATSVPSNRRGAQVDSYRGAGKWYAEVVINAIGPIPGGSDLGIAPALFDGTEEIGSTLSGGYSIVFDGRKYHMGTPVTLFDQAPEAGDVINIALADGSLWFGLNGDYMGGSPALGTLPAFTGVTGEFAVAFSGGGGEGAQVTVRLREADFTGTMPSGFAEWFDSGSSASEPAELSDILAALHDRCGHTSSDIDVSEATDMLAGVVIEQTVTGAEAINSIIGGYFLDPSEYDGQIHYIKRGKPVVRTLTVDDLIDEPETNQRKNAIEYPIKVHFFYQGSAESYASPKATSSRYSKDLQNVGEVSVNSPVTFDDGLEPAQIAAKIHKTVWAQAEGEIVWHVTDEHLDLVATDCLGLSYRGQVVRTMIKQIADEPGQRKLKMVRDRQSAVTANITEIPVIAPPTPPQPSISAPTILAPMDTSALTDGADDLHMLWAASGSTDNWAGAALQRSLDGGATFNTVDETTQNAIMGVLQEAVSGASPYESDTTNEVVVQLYTDDELNSISEDQFLSEGNAFALSWMDGDVRRWELMQFQNAELIAHKTYRLTTLQRGRLNTVAAEHEVGATFVLLDAAVRRISMQSAWLGAEVVYRAVSYGLSPESAPTEVLTYEGNSQREWPVANLLLERDGDDILATAVPRQRFGTEDSPIRSLNHVGFRWSATDGGNTTSADTESNTPTWTFDAAGWSSPVTVTVAQLNRITGEGPAVSEDIA